MNYRVVEEAAARDFTNPPPSRVREGAVDVHTHASRRPETRLLLDAASIYRVDTLVVISREPVTPDVLKGDWAGRISVAPHLTYDHLDDADRFISENLDRIERARQTGSRVIKFWFTPRFYAMTRMRLDDARLVPIFESLEREGLVALVHVSDPDIWFERKYTDRELYGTKADQYPQLENVLARHPRLSVISAHMGGDPEHLDHLQQLLDRYPNLYLDTSATKWMVRELGRQREAARDFFIRNADRILFGTDQVVTENSELVRYTSRYWTHRMFWETDVECPSPVEDPDCDGMPVIRGLDLPTDVLEKMYRRNAQRLLGLEP